MNITKYIQKIKTIYQDTSSQKDLQIKSVLEEVKNEGYQEGLEDVVEGKYSNEDPREQYQERMESEA